MTVDVGLDADLDRELARIMHAALGKFLGLGHADTEPQTLLYTAEQAAKRLGLRSKNWLEKRAAERSIPCTYIAGELRFSEPQLLKIVEMHSKGPALDPVPATKRVRKTRP